MDFMEVAQALQHIASTGSTLSKSSLLNKYATECPGFKEVLKFIYDPYFTTGLKQAKLDNGGMTAGPGYTAEEIMEFLKVSNTGDSYAVAAANSFIYSDSDPVWQWAATGLVTKDLQIGVSVTTLNKLFGSDFIPKIGIMRGMLCPDDAKGYYLCTEKIDGNRRLIFVHEENGNKFVKIYTRSGKPDTGLKELEDEAKTLPGGFVYDCECVAEGSYSDNIALRQASASLLNRHSGNRKGVKALAFDMLPIAEYNKGRSAMNAYARKLMLAVVMQDYDSVFWLTDRALLLDNMRGTHWHEALRNLADRYLDVTRPKLKHIQALPILGLAQNKKEGQQLAQPIWDAKGEGIMMVEINSAYEVNPNPRKTLLKIKATEEFVVDCLAVNEGSNKYVGMLGSISCKFVDKDGKVYYFDVGSGFADYQRAMYWDKPELIEGHKVEIDSFGRSVNAQGGLSLNCPIFKRVVGDTDE